MKVRGLPWQMLIWLFLNFIVLLGLGAAFACWTLFASNTSLFPSYMFSSNIEHEFRSLSISLEYRTVSDWPRVLSQYDKRTKVNFHIVSLDKLVPETMEKLPEKVMEAARNIPRAPFSYCNDFNYLSVYDISSPFRNANDARNAINTAPSTPVLYMRAEGRYWYGRAVLIPDNAGSSFYMLMIADAPNFYGNGLFFDINLLILLSLIILSVSFLWWLPFVRRLSRPLLRMIDFADSMAKNEFRPSDGFSVEEPLKIASSRNDEIGRLAQALATMGKRGDALVTGQLQYTRHVAHEINTPLA